MTSRFAVLAILLSASVSYGQLANTAWPKFQYDLQQTGRSPNAGPAAPVVKWSFQANNWIQSSAAIGADGSIFFGSSDYNLYAIHPDGTLKWRFPTGSFVDSSPAIDTGGTLYFGSIDSSLHALHADGTLKWTFKTGDAIPASPTIGSDGTIFTGSMDDSLYAIRPDGTPKWVYPTGADILSTPAIATNGTIYIGSQDSKLYAISAAGVLQWAYETGGPISSSPAVAVDGTIYVGSDDFRLHAVASDGTPGWTFETGGVVATSPAIATDGTIYFGSFDHNFYAVNPDGSLKWQFQTGGLVWGSSAVIDADGVIYFGSFDHHLYALNPDGTLKWSLKTGHEIFATPALGADSTLYVGSKDGKLYAIGDSKSEAGSYQIAVYYAVPDNISYDASLHAQLVESTKNIQAWYQVASGGLTWKPAFPEVVRTYYSQETWQHYRDNDWWGPLLSEMTEQGLPVWTPKTTLAIWAHGAGWWAGGAQGGDGESGVALLGVESFPQFNDPLYSGGDCPEGVGVDAWPCTPEGAFAHELGHTFGLGHPADTPELAPFASHSIMQTHWNYPDYAPTTEAPWGFLTDERSTLRANPFLYPGIDLYQLYPGADVVNLPAHGSGPETDFDMQINERTVSFINKSVDASLFYWTFGDGGVSNEFQPTHTYQDYGVYTVTLRASNDASMMGLQSTDRVVSVPSPDKVVAKTFVLEQNFPNPFNPETTIRYELTRDADVQILIYDVLGRMVKTLVDQRQPAGRHTVQWNGKDDHEQVAASGLYVYMLKTESLSMSKKLLLVR